MKSKTLIALWAGTIFLAILTAAIPQPQHRVSYEPIPSGANEAHWVAVYAPENPPSARSPAAIICQPINNGPDHAGPLALELVNRGFIALAFDWRGRSKGENRQAATSNLNGVLVNDGLDALKYLRNRLDVDPERIVIAGHSVGGNMAINVALADAAAGGAPIAATACIGMDTEVPPGQPRNLLWASGLYDEFRTPSAMRAAFERSSVHPVPRDSNISGNFADGSARGLALSPTCDHMTELLDWRMQLAAIEWFCSAVAMPHAPRHLWMAWRDAAYAAAWAALAVTAIATLRALLAPRPRAIRIAPLFGLLSIASIAAYGKAHPFFSADAAVFIFVTVPIANYLCLIGDVELRSGLRKALRNGLLIWAALLLTLIINRVPDLARNPGLLLYIPEFGVGHLLTMTYAYLIVYLRQIVFAVYAPGVLEMQWWVFAVLLLEFVKPGLLGGCIAAVAARWAARPRVKAKKPAALSLPAIGFLAALLVALGGILWVRLLQGFVTRESMYEALVFVLRYGLMPVAVFAGLYRIGRTRTHSTGAK